MSELIKTMGLRLRSYRAEKGLRQEALAELAGLHPTYIGQVERGEKNLTLESLEKITTALQIPLSQLFEQIDGLQAEGENYPLLCYELVAGQDKAEQARIYRILQEIRQISGE